MNKFENLIILIIVKNEKAKHENGNVYDCDNVANVVNFSNVEENTFSNSDNMKIPNPKFTYRSPI